jgi:hypothetical protein
MLSSGMLRRVALVRTNVSEELSAYFIKVTRIGVLGTTLALITNDARWRGRPHPPESKGFGRARLSS